MRILIIGDSFVEGVGANDKNGWAQMFSQKHQSHFIETSGIGGDNIEKISRRISDFKLNYDVVVLEIGVNDSRYRPSKNGNEIDIKVFTKELKAFVKYFRSLNKNVQIYFLGLTRVNESFTNPYKEDKYYLNKYISVYDQLLKDVSTEEKVDYVELPSLLSHDGLLIDGIHPSNEGHHALYDCIVNIIKV